MIRSLRTKVLLVLVPLAVVPAAAAVVWLYDVNRTAVFESERLMQVALLGDVRARTNDVVGDALGDARSLAQALAEASKQPAEGGDPLVSVRAVLATRRAVDAARFEVPDANVSTVLNKEEVDPSRVPTSTPELRTQADKEGWAFGTAGGGRIVMVVPIPQASAQAKKGYVTVGLHANQLRKEIGDSIDRFAPGSEVAVAVTDRSRRAVACAGSMKCDLGDDLSALGIWNIAAGAGQVPHAGLAREFENGQEKAYGTVASVPDIQWSLAVWRPSSIAFRTANDLTRRATIAAAVLIALATIAGALFSNVIVRPILRLVDVVKLVGKRQWREIKASTGRSDELGRLEGSIDEMAKNIEQSELEIERQTRLRGDLSRFMSKELVDAIVRGEHNLSLGGERRTITVLFADVVAFTPLSEKRPPEQVVAMLNELFTVLSEVVFRHGGTVDKFIGDCIMAVWGAPIHQPDHADRALAAAEDIMHFLEVAAAEWRKKYDAEVRLGIGVNSGEAIVGNIGSDKRMEYTVIGDVVNIAARLEAMAAPNQVLVAEGTQAIASDRFELVSVGEKTLTGRAAAIGVFELVTS
ncbi:MAG: adenylate/guanylate cyclase domain-containing protein [Polyangiaceae bacterium]|nr:adenylate/guanylate cyclase domain-containing protein [Polyangiaceae bacterium]